MDEGPISTCSGCRSHRSPEPGRRKTGGGLGEQADLSNRDLFNIKSKMEKQLTIVLYVLLMVAAVVGVDFLFFRHRFWERLIANIGIVLVFAAFYLRFLKRG